MGGLREEITRRLRGSRKEASVTRQALVSSASDETSIPDDPREGKQFGFYRVLRRLGSGGMGHVYLALDTRLGRHAALKFLPEEMLANSEMLQRLEQEARTASALNHPNILTIHEIGEVDGEIFIASEFVEGMTLRKAIGRGAIDPDMALRVAVQIASALTAAHSAGVVHRDLKPANVMVRPDGYVKIIDFGLAKVTDESSLKALKGAGWSLPGSVIGTVDYMSPEQARGEEVDARSDLWSFGVLLYEMLSNRRPFAGETDSHVIVAILDCPAPPLPNVASLPRGVGHIVQHALMKDPARRYQSAQEMLSDLERVGTPSSRHRAIPLARGRPSSRRSWPWVLGLLAVSLTAPALWWWSFGGRDKFLEPDWFRVDSVRQLTFNGRTQLSAISPDGKYLAFVVGDSGGTQSLHIKQVDQPSDEIRISSRTIDYLGLTFSPDSRTVYEVEEDETRKEGKLFTVPLVGERSAAPVLSDIDGPVAFSPSGDRFAFVRWVQGPVDHPAEVRNTIVTAAVDGSHQKEIFTSKTVTLLSHLAWSRKNRIAAVDIDSASSAQLILSLLNPNGSVAKKYPIGWNGVGQLLWNKDAHTILLTASSQSGGKTRSQLREFAIPSGLSHDVTKDLSGYRSVSMAADGQRLAILKMDPRAALWVSNDGDSLRGQSTIAEPQDDATLAWIDRKHLLINSRRTGYPNLAAVDVTDASASNLTNEPAVEQQATLVPGTNSVVYSSNRSGSFHIWRYLPESNTYTQLTFGSSHDQDPVVSPDGKWVIYTTWASNFPVLYKVLTAGGKPVRLTDYSAIGPQISGDGKWVACQLQQDRNHWPVGILASSGGPSLRTVPMATAPFHWSRDGKSLISAITDAHGISNLWRIPLNGSPARQLTRFDDEAILNFAWSPDGRRLACIRTRNYSDVVLLEKQPAH